MVKEVARKDAELKLMMEKLREERYRHDRLSVATDLVKNVVSTLVTIVTAEKREIPKMIVQGAPLGIQPSYTVGGLLNGESSTKGSGSESKMAFEWYTRLQPNSIEKWDKMEDSFHQQFYHCQPEVRFANLAQIVQKARETASQYVQRFKTARMRYNARIPEEEFVATTLVGIRNFKSVKHSETSLS
ncbi:hypothetical protein ACH5RR_015586 [Cinchona calisaya]|uniref:Retrotransposon gag domain-containing protein n=1 Tax=Cinchona calisaya TaxID=153742 RepID=A0ABD2ZX61_9GENT